RRGRDDRPRERRDRSARSGRRLRSDGLQHHGGVERRSRRDGPPGASKRASVQLGQQHGSAVQPALPGGIREAGGAAARDTDRRGPCGLTDSTGIHRAVDAPYARIEQVEPRIGRLLAHNPSAFTYYGTQTYLLGERELAIVDPGPDLPEHIDALTVAIGDRKPVAIMCTHTHRDHSPAARPLAERTGAPIVGCPPLALKTVGPRADASF